MSAGWVLVTRPDDEVAAFREALAAAGYSVLPFPVLRAAAVDDEPGWTAAAAAAPRLRAVVFTSPRAPRALAAAAERRGTSGALAALPAFAVGEATARAAAASGFEMAAAGGSGGADLARLVAERLGPGDAVVHACGREHRPELADVLGRAGLELVTLVVYAMEPTPSESLPPLPAAPPAAVVLTSPRAAEAYAAAAGRTLATAPHLAMGATTAACAHSLGFEVITLRRPSPAAVVEELCQTCS